MFVSGCNKENKKLSCEERIGNRNGFKIFLDTAKWYTLINFKL